MAPGVPQGTGRNAEALTQGPGLRCISATHFGKDDDRRHSGGRGHVFTASGRHNLTGKHEPT
jgi:hypothetical protein